MLPEMFSCCILDVDVNYHRPGNDTPAGACQVDFDETVTFSVTVTLEDCELAEPLK